MKLTCALLFLIGTSIPLAAETSSRDQDEVTVLLELIEMSQKNIEQQQRLLKAILSFKKNRGAFLDEPTSSRLATSLVRSAMHINDEIEKNHLAYLFSEKFLSEIRFFSKIGREQKISKESA